MFKLTLSVSRIQIKTKSEGKLITDFVTKEFDVTPSFDLKDLFTSFLYSTNYWNKGKCSKKNYIGMYGMTVDVDNGITVDEAKELFKEYNYIIHTSTSHKADLPTKGGIKDRFRIILPFDPSLYNKYPTTEAAQAIYAIIIKKFPFVDPSCAEPARKYFPFLNSSYPQLFELYINDTGVYYKVDSGEFADMVLALTSAKKTRKFVGSPDDIADGNKKHIYWDTEVVLKDKVTKVKIKDFKEVTQSVFCPFCDDINSDGTSAWITFNSDGYPILVCDHCKSVGEGNEGKYYLPLNEKHNNLFYIDDKLYCVRVNPKTISIGKVPMAYLNTLPQDEQKRLLNWVARHRWLTSEDFKLQKIVDGYAEELSWKFLDDKTTLEIRIPPIPVDIKDNDYINRWIEEMLPDHAEFFKNYLALFCYYNHEKMPILIFTGPRKSGKTTIAEFMSSFFYDCHSDWDGADDQFNSYFEKRLLIVDEAIINKKEQYTRFKAITGRKDLKVNKKHKAEYQVANNVCVILLTNELTPMYLVNTECPTDPKDNQWFMYHLDRNGKPLNSRIGQELSARAGHYIRTELRTRFENLVATDISKDCRYGIPVPITSLLKEQFENAKTSLDYECDQVFLACINGVQKKDRNGMLMETIGPFDIVNTRDLQELIDACKVRNSNVKSFKEKMQTHGFLKTALLNKNGLDAWEVDPLGMSRLRTIKGTK
jgi:hypothetical protein